MGPSQPSNINPYQNSNCQVNIRRAVMTLFYLNKTSSSLAFLLSLLGGRVREGGGRKGEEERERERALFYCKVFLLSG